MVLKTSSSWWIKDHTKLDNLDYANSGHTGFLGDAFETASKNLKASNGTITYTDWLPTIITYVNGIIKTITYTNGLPTKIVLSWTTPTGIKLTKTIAYTDGRPTSFTYS